MLRYVNGTSPRRNVLIAFIVYYGIEGRSAGINKLYAAGINYKIARDRPRKR